MKWKSEINIITAGFIFALLILLLISISTYGIFEKNKDDEALVKHTYGVLQTSKEFFSNLKDAETGQRGYIITGDEKFLEPFYMAIEKNDNLLRELKHVTSTNLKQKSRIHEIELLSKNKFFELKKTIELRRDNDPASIATIKSGKGKEIMDRIRFVFDQIDKEEQNLLLKREDTSMTTTKFTKVLLIIGLLVSITILCIIYKVLQKQIARRKKNEMALYQSREWFSKTLLGIGDGVIAADNNFIVTFMNPVAEMLTGWKEADAKGKPIEHVFQIVNEFNRTKVTNPIITAISQNKIVELANHTVLIKKDFTEIDIDDSASPVMNENGKITGAVLVFRDVTEKKKKEKEVQASNKKFTDIFNFSPVAILIYSVKDETLKYANDMFCKSMGYQREQLIGHKISGLNFISVDERKKLGEKFRKANGKLSGVETIVHKLTGETMYVITSFETIEVDSEVCIMSSFIDLTSRKMSEKRIHQLYLELENKNNDILDSIQYAKNIQNAFLPDRSDLLGLFPNSFVYYKPKNIVSGDFYWVKESGKHTLLAVADCTGHGVPGALMSMIGAQKLNEVVVQSHTTSDVLKGLNKEIKTALHQSESDTSMRDGMDIALCSVDVETGRVKYVGANRPLWIVRKGETEVEEIKGTKKGLGGSTEDDQDFITHELQLQKGDTFYLFSDGYVDQFGGEDGKKLKTKKFKQILVDIQYKTMAEQKLYLHNFLEHWKADIEQVDDVLIVGVRL